MNSYGIFRRRKDIYATHAEAEVLALIAHFQCTGYVTSRRVWTIAIKHLVISVGWALILLILF